MPTWRPLTPQTRVDLIAYIKTFSPKWQTQKAGTPITIPPEPPQTIDSVLHGRQLFDQMQCWKCHGPEGRGDGPSAVTLTDDKGEPIRPYNFHDGTRFPLRRNESDLYKIFMTGLDGTPMPSFADSLKPQDAWDLVHFPPDAAAERAIGIAQRLAGVREDAPGTDQADRSRISGAVEIRHARRIIVKGPMLMDRL